jgi:hypothetical protein
VAFTITTRIKTGAGDLSKAGACESPLLEQLSVLQARLDLPEITDARRNVPLTVRVRLVEQRLAGDRTGRCHKCRPLAL